jgi:hypothetical protein
MFSDSDTSVVKLKGEEGVVCGYFVCTHMAERVQYCCGPGQVSRHVVAGNSLFGGLYLKFHFGYYDVLRGCPLGAFWWSSAPIEMLSVLVL